MKLRPILVQTNDYYQHLWLNHHAKTLYCCQPTSADFESNSVFFQHLHLCDLDVSEGEYAILPDKTIMKMTAKEMLYYLEAQSHATMRIVASTDKKLGLPKITKEDIEWFAKNTPLIIEVATNRQDIDQYRDTDGCCFGYSIDVPELKDGFVKIKNK